MKWREILKDKIAEGQPVPVNPSCVTAHEGEDTSEDDPSDCLERGSGEVGLSDDSASDTNGRNSPPIPTLTMPKFPRPGRTNAPSNVGYDSGSISDSSSDSMLDISLDRPFKRA